MNKIIYYIDVLLAHNVSEEFTYKHETIEKPRVGMIVLAPLRSGEKIGVITKVNSVLNDSKIKLKFIKEISPEYRLNSKMIKFLNWVSNYNLIDRGLVLKMILSHSKFYFKKKKTKELTSNIKKNVKAIKLSLEQKRTSQDILKIFQQRNFKPVLLDGVPGSGKTEVYFDVIKNFVKDGEQVLIMFPEVSLTGDFVNRIEERFGFSPVVWHSKKSTGYKTKVLKSIIDGTSQIIIGARSSLFLPYKNLSMIVLDEEHDSSYKQEEQGIYHARDMSVVKSSIEDIPIILASATPSLETIFNVMNKKYNKVSIKNKYFNQEENEIFIVNMKKEKLKKDQWLSEKLIKEISQTLKKKQQTLLYINKRGYAPVIICKSCGHKITCKNCSSYLVEHLNNKKLLCHHCGHSILTKGLECPSCQNNDSHFIDYGAGIEKIFTEISKTFPLAKICLFSSDHIKSQDELEIKVKQIKDHEYDIIIGTQLITKGYHFPNLACVGIIDADMTLKGGDLRASEKTYQALYQVSGRAGRAQTKGRVIIQTYYPENETIQSLAQLDRDAFYENEIYYRKLNNLPPSGKMAAIIVSGNNIAKVREQCSIMFGSIPNISELEIYGPAPAPLSKLKGRHRQRFLIHDKKARNMQKIVNAWLKNSKSLSSVNISVDIDPFSFV